MGDIRHFVHSDFLVAIFLNVFNIDLFFVIDAHWFSAGVIGNVCLKLDVSLLSNKWTYIHIIIQK